MDAFEQSVGYRSVWLNGWPSQAEVGQRSREDLLQLAKDYFDHELAEILRSAGEWHWEVDEDRLGDIASEVAARLSPDQSGWDDLYSVLLAYYAERYRTPGEEELKARGIPLRTKQEEREASSEVRAEGQVEQGIQSGETVQMVGARGKKIDAQRAAPKRYFTYEEIGPDDVTAPALLAEMEYLLQEDEPTQFYSIAIRAAPDAEPHAERAQALYTPQQGRMGIVWGVEASFADVESAGLGIEMWLNDPYAWIARF